VPIRVLIADPDQALLTSYRDFLSQEGFQVATASTGLECVAELRTFAPDVLVLEPELPWGWGEGVLAVMHEGADVPRVPVMLLSARPFSEGGLSPAAFNINEYQVKPLPPHQLANRIRSLCDQVAPCGGFFG